VEEKTYPVQRVRDVSKHDGSSNVAAIENALAADAVVLVMGMVAVTRVIATRIELSVQAGVMTTRGSRVVTREEATLGVDARQVTRRAHQRLTSPAADVNSSGPKEGLLRES
jgi:hypothetical protein